MNEILANPIIAILLMLGGLVFVHEAGHYLVAKLAGIGVETFSIGFGPRLFSFKVGLTLYQIAWIPLGGFVKLAGASRSEEVPDAFRGQEMYRASPLARSAVLLAGPAANLLLAVIVFMSLGYQGVEHPAPVVGVVQELGPADRAGMMPGDRIFQIDGQSVEKWADLQKVISSSADKKELAFKVMRRGSVRDFFIRPEVKQVRDIYGRMKGQGRIGIGYGAVPAVATVLSDDTIAFRSGVKTGDRITNVTLSLANEEKETFPIQTWYEFNFALRQGYEKKAKALRLTMKSRAPLLKKEPKSQDSNATDSGKTVTVLWENLSGEWESLGRKASNEGLPPNSQKWGRVLASHFGLVSSELTVAGVEAGASSTLKEGDRVSAFDGTPVKSFLELSFAVTANKKQSVTISLLRDGQKLQNQLDLVPVEVQMPEGKKVVYRLPVSFFGASEYPPPFIEKYQSLWGAFLYGLRVTAEQSFVLVEAIGGLFSGAVPLQSLGGPIMIAQVAGKSAELGWKTFVTSLALISINLGIINLFPIPILDGGQLCLVGFEWVRRRPLSEAAIENFQKVGFVMIMALVVMATYNDVSRFWSSMVSGLVEFFR